jgi:hypothetical protein
VLFISPEYALMLITSPETVAPQKRANGLSCLSSRSTSPHVIISFYLYYLETVYTTLIVATCKTEKVINKYEYR